MWLARREDLSGGVGSRFSFDLDSRPASFADVLRGWAQDREFRSIFNDALAQSRFTAFRWESPPVTAATMERRFEFVLLDSPGLARRAEPQAFAQHYATAGDRGVAVFPNISGDAVLVVPCPTTAALCYVHLAAFVRAAPEWQRHTLWQAVAAAAETRIGTKPVWLSTAGAGVAWLHIRLDDWPKYYGYEPYKRAV